MSLGHFVVWEDLPCWEWGPAPPAYRWDPLVFLFGSGFAEGGRREGDLRTVYFESFCYWKATNCGFKILGRVTEPRPPARPSLLLPRNRDEAAALCIPALPGGRLRLADQEILPWPLQACSLKLNNAPVVVVVVIIHFRKMHNICS